MGRPYKNELLEIENTFMQYKDCDTSCIRKFLVDGIDIPLIIVGSGGSYAIGVAYAEVYESIGGVAKVITPYELPENHKSLSKVKVLLLTAGGNNKDTVGAYEYIRFYEPKSLMVFCVRENSIIEKKIKLNRDAILFCPRISIAKDGFLAVNSSIAMLSVLWSIERCINNKPQNNSIPVFDKQNVFTPLLDNKELETIIVMHGMWGKPAAYDLESKCSEAGLFNVQVVDFRNFAHGRHNWIDKKGNSTAIIALITGEDLSIANRTLKRLPNNTEIIVLKEKGTGVLAILNFLIQIMYLVDVLGDIRNIDPGRPHVPNYGSELYGLKVDLGKMDNDYHMLSVNRMNRAIYRIIGTKMNNPILYQYYYDKYECFINRLENYVFAGIVFDYDGTIYDRDFGGISSNSKSIINKLLLEGVMVGFATGRGDSIILPIKEMIPNEEYWHRIYIGYHNGAKFQRLSDPYEDTINQNETEHLQSVYSLVKENKYFSDIHLSRDQLSIRINDASTLNYAYEYCSEILEEYGYLNLRVLKSGHAVDIINAKNGKQTFIDEFKKRVDGAVLCIGDEGKLQENDYDMLSKNNALSVKNTNTLANTGWNIAPVGKRGILATDYYLECIESIGGKFRIRIN